MFGLTKYAFEVVIRRIPESRSSFRAAASSSRIKLEIKINGQSVIFAKSVKSMSDPSLSDLDFDFDFDFERFLLGLSIGTHRCSGSKSASR